MDACKFLILGIDSIFVKVFFFLQNLRTTPVVRLTESPWTTFIGVPPVLLKATVSQSQTSRTFSWPTLQSRGTIYLKCMLVFKSLYGLAPSYLQNESSH